MIPHYYQHFCPVKILSGHNAVSNIPFEMDILGCRRAMVVTDKGVVDAGLINLVREAFADSDKEIGYVFDEVLPDSSNRLVNKLAKLFEKEKCDCFLAVGGGSALDTAKGANIVISEGTDDILLLQGNEIIKKELLPMIAVPTTSGTGSEVTKVAVIYNEEKNIKMAFASDRLYPRVAVLDSRMTMTVPPKLTAATGMDALTHAMEAYTCMQKNPIDDVFARAAIELIRKYLVRAVENGKDEEARLGMANASLLAGIAFSNSMVGMVHALAHACGGVCHVPHGIANAILLPHGLEFNIQSIPRPIAELSGMLGGSIEFMEEKEQAMVTVSLVKNLLGRLNRISGLPVRLRDAGVAEDKLPAIASAAINDGALAFNPVEVSYDEALEVLKKAY
ncbi:MAG: iron-containing alcohol dehydrogenase [Desulfomonilia bacterium]|jgi:alcohol dehydrogenase|uniref:1,3-propanediol dehydrogenase n=1 Tax=anaerobic digester metagenome TaxID=1263854 RepID=A0A485M801_9ZZZZ|nr:iron-containing alcohol dehydrogenase [Pseudomonadota bacterium]HON38687.1 iron-containing alcohol dehydrogenase [Deltaproteobacteria bacterium]HRS56157.1 iron-containing alcohol dehydrogenase [Desulfomonilia bacterium]HPD21166.1 iron-containing alcohol dehydrogenase [Deltaproteobacteria bacterium]HPX18133.1 iron-containing alcohol dehydrogenase [Deltaproteobacteria bacterium]